MVAFSIISWISWRKMSAKARNDGDCNLLKRCLDVPFKKIRNIINCKRLNWIINDSYQSIYNVVSCGIKIISSPYIHTFPPTYNLRSFFFSNLLFLLFSFRIHKSFHLSCLMWTNHIIFNNFKSRHISDIRIKTQKFQIICLLDHYNFT